MMGWQIWLACGDHGSWRLVTGPENLLLLTFAPGLNLVPYWIASHDNRQSRVRGRFAGLMERLLVRGFPQFVVF